EDPSSYQSSDLDYIYNKSHKQMKWENEIQKQDNDEIDEEKKETLENPQNSGRSSPLLSDSPPDLREQAAAFDAMKLAFEEQKAIADKKSQDAFNYKREILRLKSTIAANANANNNKNNSK